MNGFRRTGPQEVPRHVTDPSIHKCVECSFEFQSEGILKAHRMTHQKSIRCEICAKEFVTQGQIVKHKLAEHKVKEN